MTTLIYNSIPAHLRPSFRVRDPNEAYDELNALYTQLRAVTPGTVFPEAEKIAVRRCLAGLMCELYSAPPATLLNDLQSLLTDDGAYSDKEMVTLGSVIDEGLKQLLDFNKKVTICSLILQGLDLRAVLASEGSVKAAAEKVAGDLGFRRS